MSCKAFVIPTMTPPPPPGLPSSVSLTSLLLACSDAGALWSVHVYGSVISASNTGINRCTSTI